MFEYEITEQPVSASPAKGERSPAVLARGTVCYVSCRMTVPTPSTSTNHRCNIKSTRPPEQAQARVRSRRDGLGAQRADAYLFAHQDC